MIIAMFFSLQWKCNTTLGNWIGHCKRVYSTCGEAEQKYPIYHFIQTWQRDLFSRKKTDGFQKYSTAALGQMIFYWNSLYLSCTILFCDNDICLILYKTKIQDDKRVIRIRGQTIHWPKEKKQKDNTNLSKSLKISKG
jgi:hypothetical protein